MNQLLNKRTDTYLIVLDDIDPISKWGEECHSSEFGPNFDIDVDDLGWDTLDANPLVVGDVGTYPEMAGSGSDTSQCSCAACASTSIATRVVDVPGQSEPDVDSECYHSN